MEYSHTPVLLKEVLEYLSPKANQNFVDATLGGGGYSLAIIKLIAPQGKLLSIDLDKDAINNARVKSQELGIKNLILHHGNFRDIGQIIKDNNFPEPDGIVADIGLSSYQLEDSGRGISFQKKEILDMRFDANSKEYDAKYILNNYTEENLRKIFEDYGEEKFSRQIVKQIVNSRQQTAIHFTTDLYQAIVKALPKPVKHKADDSARRIFQALRIAVNKELENLEVFLPKAFTALKPGGRLAIVSFHSLEDRIVKQYFVSLTKGCICPPEFPICLCNKKPLGKILTRKPITASPEELTLNPRSKPAKLRVIEKL